MYSTQVAALASLLGNTTASWDGSKYPTYSSGLQQAAEAPKQTPQSLDTGLYAKLFEMTKQYLYNYKFRFSGEYEEPYSSKFPTNSDGMW